MRGVLAAVALCTGMLLAPAAGAADADPANGLAQLRSFVEGTRAAQGEFTQRTQRTPGGDGSAAAGAGRSASGRFAFARPGRFRWEVLRPEEQLIVSDGKQVWFYDRDLEQVTIRPMGDAIGASPAAILFGSDAIERDFAVRDAGVRDGVGWIEATPHRRDAGFELIRIGLRNGLPVAMEIRDAFGQQTRLSFESVRRDPQPDLNRFRFVPPPGVDVLRP